MASTMRTFLGILWDAVRPVDLRSRWRTARANRYFAFASLCTSLIVVLAVAVSLILDH
jgi:hypothetical protein